MLPDVHPIAELDHLYVWHPFTQMKDWLAREPIVIESGRGAVLRDQHGKEYLDANSSIWTNLHGHRHPKLNQAVARQLKKIAHSSALGFANEPASLLAQRLVMAVNCAAGRGQTVREHSSGLGRTRAAAALPRLNKVFFSDDGSTAVEVALKLAYEFARRTGRSDNPQFLSLDGAYHGDTVGAVSLGHIPLFHKAYAGLLFNTEKVMAPYCYRCPFNRAEPERADARTYRKCRWECVDQVEQKFKRRGPQSGPLTGLVVEPLIQGAAGMIPQPIGWLRRVAEIVRGNQAQLIADEVLTGFGRTGLGSWRGDGTLDNSHGRSVNRSDRPTPLCHAPLFACQHEGVEPDFMALAKGLTAGYLPMAATLTTQSVFEAFLGDYSEFKTFFHGHSYGGNQLGSAAALASLDLLEGPASIRARHRLEERLRSQLGLLWDIAHVGDIRQVGLVAGIELVKDWRTRRPFDLRERAGIRVCEAMARRGVLTRPIGNVVVLMPPYCTTSKQLDQMIAALRSGIEEAL